MWISDADLDGLYDQNSPHFSLENDQKAVYYIFDKEKCHLI